jgi:hypothetical protein
LRYREKIVSEVNIQNRPLYFPVNHPTQNNLYFKTCPRGHCDVKLSGGGKLITGGARFHDHDHTGYDNTMAQL